MCRKYIYRYVCVYLPWGRMWVPAPPAPWTDDCTESLWWTQQLLLGQYRPQCTPAGDTTVSQLLLSLFLAAFNQTKKICIFNITETRTNCNDTTSCVAYKRTIRTSSQRLAAVRNREAMLLASVNSRSLCLNLGSYLRKESTRRICLNVKHLADALKQSDWGRLTDERCSAHLNALMVVSPSTVSEKCESRGSCVLSSSCWRSLQIHTHTGQFN